MATHLSASDEYVVKETATLNWTINDFRKLNNQVNSNEFSPPNSNNKFRLHLNSKTTFLSLKEVFISLQSSLSESKFLIQYRVSIVNANGDKQENLINGSFLSINNLVNGNLIINCEVDVLERLVNNNTNVTIGNDQTNLQSDYQTLLEKSDFSDVSLLVKEKEFKVHKAILAARSKVFEAMFSADLEEKKQNRVEITDVEVDVFEHLLRYIYTGKIAGLDEYGLELFVAADKYQLDHLKIACEQFLSSSFAIESVVNVLVIADMHNASELKSKCIEYITSKSDEVKGTDAWKEMKSRPALLMELYDKLADKMKSLSLKS